MLRELFVEAEASGEECKEAKMEVGSSKSPKMSMGMRYFFEWMTVSVPPAGEAGAGRWGRAAGRSGGCRSRVRDAGAPSG